MKHIIRVTLFLLFGLTVCVLRSEGIQEWEKK